MLAVNTTLTSLDLSYNSVGDTGATAILRSQNSSLKVLNLSLNHVSHNVIQQINSLLARNAALSSVEPLRAKKACDDNSVFPPIPSKQLTNGYFQDEGNARFQSAVLDHSAAAGRSRKLQIKKNKYSDDLV
mmetsp:Transcript_18615/g.51410  ORF Transcript_18615/g.51410 Transcript_18615/m.51410 type:complete len:131 (+) Transcript_18615:295-687(+)|eukprot:CAMPEP_0113693890 /NCGR_PEP_ID=MMETSP0038_2-20120614/19939_1 /TAXON_ID=2898 /ORGANISM="Cryptomonas paramecium" /LENGTH=130 /DNA_ID=CAMNT_0000616059 /DNA_START=368 /DNA_END=760 /DNA_ORIENTATION=+ /assembly_acc=CAM_ASM_000170